MNSSYSITFDIVFIILACFEGNEILCKETVGCSSDLEKRSGVEVDRMDIHFFPLDMHNCQADRS
jgi:hypothetical protein